MSAEEIEKDPIKIHREGTALYDTGQYKAAMEKFVKAAELYKKLNNFFDASYSLFKAGECSFLMKNYEESAELFLKSAELAFSKSFDRFAVSALEYARDCFKALGNEEKTAELERKIKEVKEKLAQTF
jgi:tetratricopeptide (TPR) repeat protein